MSVGMIKEHECNIQNLYTKHKKNLFLIQLPLTIVNRNVTQRLSQNMKKYLTESESQYGLKRFMNSLEQFLDLLSRYSFELSFCPQKVIKNYSKKLHTHALSM